MVKSKFENIDKDNYQNFHITKRIGKNCKTLPINSFRKNNHFEAQEEKNMRAG